MQTDLGTLKEKVLKAAQNSVIAPLVEDIVLETARDDEGADFLRVIIQVKNADKADDSDFEKLLESIEQAVGDVDERYPSVRFSDAA